MEIIKLKGEEKQLYELVAHLVMNEKVLKYNLNYPYKTSSAYWWFVAKDGEKTIGFIPVKMEDQKIVINNYYVEGDDKEVFSTLLKEISEVFPDDDYMVDAIVQTRHISNFEQNGFSVALYWKRYAKMKISKGEKKCL